MNRAAPKISGPLDGHLMKDQTPPEMVADRAETSPTGHSRRVTGLVHPHPDPARVYQEGPDQPAGANAVHDPKSGLEAGQQPINNAAQGTSTVQGHPNAQVVEGKLPFKEQARACGKVQEGTLLGDRELKETGRKILAREIPPR